MSYLSNNLKLLRKNKGILQKELAQDLNCTVGTVSNYENGVHQPDLFSLVCLANYYGVSVDYLLGRTSCICPINTMEQVIQGNYTIGRFLALLMHLSDQDKAVLVHILLLMEK